jgi:Zn-dependent protease with chaperone function
MNTPRRFPLPTPLLADLARALALAMLLIATLSPVSARAQSHEDRHVSAIARHALLSVSPVALVDPVRQRRARAIADYQQGVFVGWALAPILALLWLWRSANAARLRDLLRRRIRAPWMVRAAFGASLGVLAMLASLPFAFAAYRIDAIVGLSFQPIPSWVAGEIARIVTVAALSAAAVAVVLELVDRTRLWYLAFIALLYALTLAVVAIEPVLLSPLASHHRPAPARIVAIGDAVAQRLGTPAVSVDIATEVSRSGLSAARTSGLGPFTRIVLDNDAIARTTAPEVAYILARQYVHVQRGDVLVLALWGTTLFVVAGAFAVLVSDRIGFRRDDDPLARLALVGACLGVAVLVLLPVDNAVERKIESRADVLAVRATRDPASAARLFVRNANDSLIPLCGRRTTRWYFNVRAPLGSRIATVTGRPDPCPG